MVLSKGNTEGRTIKFNWGNKTSTPSSHTQSWQISHPGEKRREESEVQTPGVAGTP